MSEQKPEDEGKAAEPQVIDLVAEEIEDAGTKSRAEAESAEEIAAEAAAPAEPVTEQAEVPPPPPTPAPKRRKARGAALLIVAALILGAIGGGWLYRDVLARYFPTNEIKALQVRLDTLEGNDQALSGQVAAASQTADAAGKAASAADAAAKSAASGIAGLATRIDGNEQRFAQVEDALNKAKADLDALRKSLSASDSGGTAAPASTAALAALGQRIDTLEKDVASLKSSGGSGSKASVTAALSQALSDLKAKVAAGAPFAAEYDRIARMVPAAAGLDVLASNARNGLPAADGLAKELRALIVTLPQPEAPAPAAGSYWGSLLQSLSGIVTIREIGNTDWPQLAGKAAALAESGDLPQAISLIDAAEGDKPVALSQWRDRAAARLELEAALAQASDAVIRQIAALGGTP